MKRLIVFLISGLVIASCADKGQKFYEGQEKLSKGLELYKKRRV